MPSYPLLIGVLLACGADPVTSVPLPVTHAEVEAVNDVLEDQIATVDEQIDDTELQLQELRQTVLDLHGPAAVERIEEERDKAEREAQAKLAAEREQQRRDEEAARAKAAAQVAHTNAAMQYAVQQAAALDSGAAPQEPEN